MPGIDRYELLAAKTRQEFPRFNVRDRDASWLRWPFRLLKKITGQDYTEFTTTIFSTIYVGASWHTDSSLERYKTLRHEKKHIEQFHSWPFGRWWWPLNHIVMALCYLLVLPLLLTLRAKFEREGYTQTLLVDYELYGPFSDDRMESNAAWLAETFGGSAYFYMWRRKAAYAWAMDVQAKINHGLITNPADRVDPPAVAAPPR